MKKDFIYIHVIILLVALALSKWKPDTSEYDQYKKEAEAKIAAYQDSLVQEQLRFDSIVQNMDSLTNIVKTKKENVKVVYVEGKKEFERVIALDSGDAVRFLTGKLHKELNK